LTEGLGDDIGEICIDFGLVTRSFDRGEIKKENCLVLEEALGLICVAVLGSYLNNLDSISKILD
jgi:hypothetical protein